MLLSVLERMSIAELFPKEANMVQQILVKDIFEKVKFEQEEIKEIDLRVDNETKSYGWSNELAQDKDIKFTAKEISFLQDRIEEFDKEKKITQRMLSLCLKIKEE